MTGPGSSALHTTNWHLLCVFTHDWRSVTICHLWERHHGPKFQHGHRSLISLLISLSKHTRKDYHCFWWQHICYITIDVWSYAHGSEKILSLLNIQQMSAVQQCKLFSHTCNVHTLINSKLTLNCTTTPLSIKWSAVCQDGGVINILVKPLRTKTIESQLVWWIHIVM